ncbi:MAG: hypothetical protein NT027_07895, partial [Proteobacteria bacterium]|nr:hypothetical protein [Pseudomonadota bacterium]
YDDFDLDITADFGLGFFFPHRLDELKQYCKSHPQFHIMSLLPSAVKVNMPIPDAKYYQLAEGDSDPNLWYVDSACKEILLYSEINKFDRG